MLIEFGADVSGPWVRAARLTATEPCRLTIGACVEGLSGRSPGRTAGLAGNLPVKVLVGTAVTAAVVVLGVLHRTAVDAGGDSLAGVDGEWLALAALATLAMWSAGTASFLGTLPARPPLGRLLAVQFAASFANHLLPAGSGAMAVNVRFLRRHGVSRGAAVGAVGLNSLATGVTHVVLLVAIVVADTAGRYPVIRQDTADFAYLRLHGDEELYTSGYTDEALDRWAADIRDRLDRGMDVYAYFDNDVKVRAPYDAMGLRDRLRA